jgi:uncharacterized membrane protein YesL
VTPIGEPVDRPDWRDSLSTASDLALIGIGVALLSVPVVTAGAALATATVAVDELCRTRSLPAVRDLARTFVRAAPAGLLALVVSAIVGLLLYVDILFLAAGTIPGGVPVIAAVFVVGAVLLSLGLVTVVRVGQTAGTGWRTALRWSLRLLAARPLTGPAVLVAVAVPVALSLAIPAIAFVLPGFTLYALHVIVRRASRPA